MLTNEDMKGNVGEKSTKEKKKVMITKDVSFEDVLQYDQDGVTLVWDVDSFLELGEGDLRKLKKATRDRYSIFRELAEEQKGRKAGDEAVVAGITVAPDVGRATSKLDVRGKNPTMDYRWERPDMVNVRLEQGYRVAKGVRTLRGADDKGIHRIGSSGQDELILLEVPKDVKASMKADRRRRRERAFTGQEEQAKSEIERLGGGRVDDKSSGNFAPISREEERNG